MDLIARAQSYDAALAARDFAAAASHFADEAVYVSPGVGGTVTGRAAIRAMFEGFFARHPLAHWHNDRWFLRPGEAQAVSHEWELHVPGEQARRGTETSWFDAAGLIIRLEVGG